MPIDRVFVAGAGLMGHGIGQVHAAIGKHVTLYEPDLARAEAGRDRIAGNLDRAVAKGKLDSAERDAIIGRIIATDDLELVRSADLVVEAVFEDVEVKRGAVARSSTNARRRRRSSPRTRARSRSTASPTVVSPARREALRRHALLQPGAGHAARRADPWRGHDRRDRSRRSGSWRTRSARSSSCRRIGPGSS